MSYPAPKVAEKKSNCNNILYIYNSLQRSSYAYFFHHSDTLRWKFILQPVRVPRLERQLARLARSSASCDQPTAGSSYAKIEKQNNRFGVKTGFEKHPVVETSWFGAVAYCNWLSEQDGLQKVYSISGSDVRVNWTANGYRLPTEAEWEYAARSRGGNDKWSGTFSESNLASYANGGGSADRYENTAPVGSFQPNGLGLYDMSGNVWEWCWDWFESYSKSISNNPTGPNRGSRRVLRGGSWILNPAGLFVPAESPARDSAATKYVHFLPLSELGFVGFEDG